MLGRPPPLHRDDGAAHRVHDVVHGQVVLLDLAQDVAAAVDPVQARQHVRRAGRPVVPHPDLRSPVETRREMVLPDHGGARLEARVGYRPPVEQRLAGSRDVGEVEHGQAGKDGGDLSIDALEQVHGFLLRSAVLPRRYYIRMRQTTPTPA
jgi:hypothetical protein